MARPIGPDEASRKAEVVDPATQYFRAKRNKPATFYTDAQATQLADIVTLDGAVIAGSTVTTDAYSMIPLFRFPDGVDTLYVVCDNGPVWPVYARTDDRLDTLSGRVDTVEATAGAGETTAGAQAKADAAQATAAGALAAHEADTTAVHGIANTAALVVTTDPRLSDPRTPTAHAASHATGGSDPVAPSAIGAVPTSRAVTAGTGLTGGGALTADRSLAVVYGTTAGTVAAGDDRRLKRVMSAAPGAAGIPTIMSSPYAVTAAVVSAVNQTASASTIVGAIHVRPAHPGAFTFRGGQMINDGTFVGGSIESVRSYGASTGPINSAPPYSVDFLLDTVGGSFDIATKDTVSTFVRIAVDGQYLSAGHTKAMPGNTGSPVIVNVSGLAPGRHTVSVEFAGGGNYFCGVNIGPTDQVTRTAIPPLKLMVVGDSFTEPTITESTAGYARWGWAQILGQMLGVNAVASGSGGTGYLNPGSPGRVKFRDRLTADIIAFAPDAVMWAGGINDYTYTGYSRAVLQAEAAACFAQVAGSLPSCTQIVLSPFYLRGYQAYPTALLEARDAISAAASAAALTFVDVLEVTPEYATQTSGTLATPSSVGATSISCSVRPRDGSLLRIGVSGAAEIRSVVSTSGSGPYTATLTVAENPLSVVHAAGDPVVVTGPGISTGTGQQGTPTGSGTADRYRGSDGTHPTSDFAASGGHPAIARAVFAGMLRTSAI